MPSVGAYPEGMPATTTSAPTPRLAVTGDAEADALLVEEPLALLIGMLLDQQVPMEWAFRGPATLKARLGGRLDAARIAALGEDRVVEIFSEKPALHRFPGSMGRRTHALCRFLVDEYGGDAAAVWTGAKSGAALLARVQALPGFGEEKARIFVALLAKRLGVKPRGWRQASAPFSDAVPRSVADIDSPEARAEVRAWKKAQKAAGKSKAD
ncbi:MAG: (Fe-S)-cluster assembly protein [Acidimicrobiia bacterium]